MYVKFVSATSSAKDGREKRKLPGDLPVRDVRGRLDRDQVEEVEAILKRLGRAVGLGEDPFREAGKELEPEVLTIGRGFRRALGRRDGKFPVKTDATTS